MKKKKKIASKRNIYAFFNNDVFFCILADNAHAIVLAPFNF